MFGKGKKSSIVGGKKSSPVGTKKISLEKKIPLKDKKSSSPKFFRNYAIQIIGLLLGSTILLTYLISSVVSFPNISMQVGEISPKDIKAPKDFQVEDKTTTIKRQKEAEAKVLPVYDYDNRLLAEIDQKIHSIFDLLKKDRKDQEISEEQIQETLELSLSKSSQSGDSEISSDGTFDGSTFKSSTLSLNPEPRSTPKEKWKEFKEKTSLNISFEEYQYLLQYSDKNYLRKAVTRLLKQVMKNGILGSLNFALEEEKNGFIKRNITTGEEIELKDISGVLNEDRAKKELQKAALLFFSEDRMLSHLVSKVTNEFVYPNMTLNLSETRLRKKSAVENVKPSFFQIKKGEMIVREGERITESHVTKLNELTRITEQENIFLSFLGLGVIILLTLIMLLFFIKRHHPAIADDIKYLLLIFLVIVVTIFFNKMFVYIANGLSATIALIEPVSYFYAFPFAAAAMLIALLLDDQIAVMVSAVVAIFSCLLLSKDFYFFLVAFFGGLGAIYGLVYMSHRTAIVRAGAMVSLANLAVIIPLDMAKGVFFSWQGVSDCLFGIIGGLVVATLVSALIPVFESLFKLTTDIKLLELLNMNQPILRRLATVAPGTYHHSIIVGNLAEAACDAIGANSLLARVASNYHDIGKIKKPRYFVENQMNFKNEHEKLSPSMSGLILISHVKDGIELARQNKVSPMIIDMISQHHGTSLQKFFYKKAKDQEEKESQKIQIIKEEDYRYPGPKPQTKEAGIVMLADAVEAASRTLTEPSPSRIKGLILTIINNVFKDGQLDECELTLKDLHQIAGSFNRILTGIFHQRIPYPNIEAENGKKEKNGDSNQKSTKDNKNKYNSLEEDSEENFKRLGLSNPGSEYPSRHR